MDIGSIAWKKVCPCHVIQHISVFVIQHIFVLVNNMYLYMIFNIYLYLLLTYICTFYSTYNQICYWTYIYVVGFFLDGFFSLQIVTFFSLTMSRLRILSCSGYNRYMGCGCYVGLLFWQCQWHNCFSFQIWPSGMEIKSKQQHKETNLPSNY